MRLTGTAEVVSTGTFTTKNGKEMRIYNLGDRESFQQFAFTGMGDLPVYEKGTRVEYTITVSKNGKYTNIFLVEIKQVSQQQLNKGA